MSKRALKIVFRAWRHLCYLDGSISAIFLQLQNVFLHVSNMNKMIFPMM